MTRTSKPAAKVASKPKAAPAPAPATPTKGKAPGGPGVITRLIHHLQQGGGTTQELFDKLKADFPERGDGMLTTVKIQVKRLNKQGKLAIASETVDGRTVYRAEAPVEG